MVVVLTASAWAYQVWENRQREAGKRDHRLVGKTPEECAFLGQQAPSLPVRSSSSEY